MPTFKPQTHCLRGHEFTPENTKLRKGVKHCRECIRIRSRQQREQKPRPLFMLGHGQKPMRTRLLERVVLSQGCWNWTGSVDRGKPIVDVGERSESAARAMYREAVGHVPNSKKVVRICDNGLCINPAHLSLENVVKYGKSDAELRRELREYVDSRKSGPCMDCEMSFHPCAMDFDHRDPTTKVAPVSELVAKGRSKSRIDDEIAKCDLVCSNCHRVRSMTNNHHLVRRTG